MDNVLFHEGTEEEMWMAGKWCNLHRKLHDNMVYVVHLNFIYTTQINTKWNILYNDRKLSFYSESMQFCTQIMMTIIGLSCIILSPVGLGISKMTRNNTRLRSRTSIVLWIKRGLSKMADVIDISFLNFNKPVANWPDQSLISGMEVFAVFRGVVLFFCDWSGWHECDPYGGLWKCMAMSQPVFSFCQK